MVAGGEREAACRGAEAGQGRIQRVATPPDTALRQCIASSIDRNRLSGSVSKLSSGKVKELPSIW